MESHSDEKEDQEDSTSELEVFLAVVISQIGQTGKHTFTGHHRVGEDHEKSANNGEIAEEEIDVKDETVTESLKDNNTQKTSDCDFRVAFGDDGSRGTQHCQDVEKEENMRNAPWEVAVFLEIPVLITPLGRDSKGVFDESDHDEETANSGQMRLQGLGINVDHVLQL